MMKRRQGKFPGLLVAAALLLPLFQGAAEAQGHHGEMYGRVLSVIGEGIVRARPDMAVISLGVVSEAESAGAALSANSEQMRRTLAGLEEAGMQSRDIQTSGFNVSPVYSQPPPDYDHSRPFRPEIVGYQVTNNVTLRVRDLDRLGTLLDQVVTLGANSISGPTFTVADPTPLEDQARRAAMRDALRKGSLYADAADLELGQISRIEENFTQPPQPFAPPMMRMEAAQDSSVPIESGELVVTAQVSVTWQLGD
jgi:uncharacterized protein YggE